VEVKASLNNLRISPRKVRLVTNLLKGLDYEDAVNQLRFTVKRSARPLVKLLNSAVANAENNFNLLKSNLYVKSIVVNEGRKLKRFRAKGFGRAMAIQKKVSMINLVLDERTPGLKVDNKAELKTINKELIKKEIADQDSNRKDKPAKADIKKEPEYIMETKQKPKSGFLGNIKRRIFRRKSI